MNEVGTVTFSSFLIEFLNVKCVKADSHDLRMLLFFVTFDQTTLN